MKFENSVFEQAGTTVQGSNGGLFRILDRDIEVVNCSFICCFGTRRGIFGFETLGKYMKFSKCFFWYNTAAEKGGVMYSSSNSVEFSNCNFFFNMAAEGGALNFYSNIGIIISSCSFVGNKAKNGGFIYLLIKVIFHVIYIKEEGQSNLKIQ
jgi:hypothetical protein